MENFVSSLLVDLSPVKITATVLMGIIVWTLVQARNQITQKINSLIPTKPLLVFVSTGGTCRDPMAKVITEEALGARASKISIIAAGTGEGSTQCASRGARIAVEEAYGKDLLKKTRYTDNQPKYC